jgi:iron complex outermembrane recepter protein
MDHTRHKPPQRTSSRIFTRSALARAISHITLGGAAVLAIASLPSMALAQPAAAQARSYSIPPGPLEDTLNRFGREAGILLSFTPETTAGLRSPGLQGSYSVQAGLDTLLVGSGLQATRQPNGSYVLNKVQAGTAVTGEAKLPVVTVTASAEQETAWGPVNGYVAKRSATATKTDTPIIETPQSITVVTRDQMTEQNVQSVSDALRYSAGVLAEANGPDPRADNIVVRGFDTGGRDTYRDGLRSYAFNNQGGTVYETYGLERIEVLRGPSSILYGQGGAGGLVNLISKRPTAEPIHELQIQVGENNRTQLAGDFAGKLTEDGEWTYRLTSLLRDSDTFIDHVKDDRQYIAPALTWTPDADTSFTLLMEYQRNQRGQGYQAVPRVGTLDSNPNGKISTSTFLGEPGFDRFDQERASIGYILEHRLSDQLTFRQNARYQEMETKANTVYMTGLKADNRTVGRYGSQGTEKVKNAVIDTQVQWDWQHGMVEHTTLLGFDAQSMSSDSQTSYGNFNDLDVYQPVYGQSSTTLTLGEDSRQRLTQSGIYLQDQIKIDKTWVATLGVRRDSTKQTTDDHLEGSQTTQKDSATTGRVGLVYLAPSGFAPYVSYSESFTPVVDTTYDGSAFKPETGQQYEVGVRYQPVGSSLSVTASVFDLTRQNVTTDDLEHAGFSTQRGEVNSRGFELEAKANLGHGWDVLGSYSHGKTKLTKDNSGNEGNQLSNVPQNTVATWVHHTVQSGNLKGLGIGVGVRYVGSSYANDENTEKIPAYTLIDLALRYDLRHLNTNWNGWQAALNVSNLFDKEYVATCGYYGDACKYGYRRNAILTLTYRW